MNKRHTSPYLAAFSPDMKLFELVEMSPSLLSILSRLDVRLPFGDISVRDLCEREEIADELFLILCSMHTDASFRPDVEALKPEMLAGVVRYLRLSHNYYAEHMLPHTSAHLERILDHCDKLSHSVLRRFYDDYTTYIEHHFEQEERFIFDLVDEGGIERDKADCSLFDMPHTDIDDRSNDIASLIFKSLPEAAPTKLRCAMLEHIYALRDDLRRHSNVEEYLLKPLVEKHINAKQ